MYLQNGGISVPSLFYSFDKTVTFLNVKEDVPIGSSIGHVTARDNDSGENARITYSLELLNNVFSLNSSTGEYFFNFLFSFLFKKLYFSYSYICCMEFSPEYISQLLTKRGLRIIRFYQSISLK